jgi:hypothetical protein
LIFSGGKSAHSPPSCEMKEQLRRAVKSEAPGPALFSMVSDSEWSRLCPLCSLFSPHLVFYSCSPKSKSHEVCVQSFIDKDQEKRNQNFSGVLWKKNVYYIYIFRKSNVPFLEKVFVW